MSTSGSRTRSSWAHLLLGAFTCALAVGGATPAQAATVETIREATVANAAALQSTVQDFRNGIGGNNNGATPGEQPSGRRQIVWDGTPDFNSAGPNNAAGAPTGRLPHDFFKPNGAIFSTPGVGFQVSMDDDNDAGMSDLDPDQVEFDNLNGTYDTAFDSFSPEKLFTALGSTITTVHFVIAGSNTPAGVSGFGAVFTDVDVAGSTKIEYFDDEGELILSRDVLATPGNASFSFLGVKVSLDDPIGSVRITSGALAPSTVGQSANDVTQGGALDAVVMDDFIFGEPHTLPAAPTVQFADPSLSGPEGTTASVEVTRAGDLDEPAQVAFETRDGSASAGEDYLPAGGTVSFAAGETSKTIPVNLLSDRAVDDGETLEVALAVPAAGTVLGSPATATLAITDVPDAVRPDLTRLEVVPPAFELGRSPISLARNPKSARILFRLSEEARVAFSFERLTTGRLVRGRCVRQKRSNRRAKRCTRVTRLRQTAAVNGSQGGNAVRFEGLITRSSKLAVGRYRVVTEAVDAAGNRSAMDRAAFRILRRGG